MVKLLDVEQVIGIHDWALASFGGGSPGVLDLALIEASVARMSSGVRGQEFFPDLFDKAAALLESLIRNHGFVDGNKRTAILSAGTLLERTGRHLSYTPEEVVQFTLGVANHEIDPAEIVAWLRAHSQKT